MTVTVKFVNDHGVDVTLRGRCRLDCIKDVDVCDNAVYESKSDNLDDITTYDVEGVGKYFPFYFYCSEDYGEDYEVHAYVSPAKGCWVVSHITAYWPDGELKYEIGGKTQKIAIKIK